MNLDLITKSGDETRPSRRLCDNGLQALELLRSPALDPLFWQPERLGSPSAWWPHVPFAYWIVDALAPRTLVELAAHVGVSYAALCQAVARRRLDTRCYAVETRQGDPSASDDDEAACEDFRRHHDENHGGFSKLLRCTADEALGQFAAGSIDLLHIDGFGAYDAVKRAFEDWGPKLSGRAVVLFHRTNAMLDDIGVARLWSELRQHHPGFEFLHGHGLGVLTLGPDISPAIAALCALTEPTEIASLRGRFATLGERWHCDTRVRLLGAEMAARVAAASAQATEAQAAVVAEAIARAEKADREAMRHAAEAAAMARRYATESTLREQAALRTKAARQETLVALTRADEAETERNRTRAELRLATAELKRARAQRDAVTASTLWRATWPLRALGRCLPYRVRRALRAGARVGWWCLTLQLPRRLKERRTALATPSPETVTGTPPSIRNLAGLCASGAHGPTDPTVVEPRAGAPRDLGKNAARHP